MRPGTGPPSASGYELAMDSIDLLLLEHQQMERVLEALDVCAGRVEDGDDSGMEDLEKFGLVFQGADQPWHLSKEELLLVPLMAEHGVSTEEGLLAALRREHEEQRRLARELVAAARSGDAQRSVELAFAFTDHARCHMFTEDTLVFPKARKDVPASALRALEAQFGKVEQELEGSADYLRAKGMLEELLARYGTNPSCIQPRVSWQGTEE